ncbi:MULTISPECIES: hypothetical protein [unclassified Kitasatospora]|uniref:hypothetical protein n=1 Tax=unclassified Kitasatospora TaxID=2633591 RepID=UPI00070F0AFF|nr:MULTISPECIES: hypothetical protein [unclassified Kitasatospora]KQV16804.1 hypothetical protein ASC99_26905 [Kitasatospora sp. Root107]KRB73748.1 hypothetical protein ASE03_21415 [Kitasatospora sp. Root187]
MSADNWTAAEARRVPPLRAGRRAAGLALFGWLDDPRAPRLCRVAGSSGSGRTHLLAWLAAAAPADHPRSTRRVHAVLPTGGLMVDDAVRLLANRLGGFARTPAELLAIVQDGQPRTIVVTGLDQAGGPPDWPRQIAAEVLVPLLAVPGLRLAVESADGTAATELLTAAVPGAAVLDLDDPRWTDRDVFAAWCARLPGPSAASLYPSPGLAQLAALVDGGVAVDPTTPPAERARAVCAAWWEALPEELRPTVRALAVAGCAVSAEEWAALPGAGGAEAVARAGALSPPGPDGASWELNLRQLAAFVRPAWWVNWTYRPPGGAVDALALGRKPYSHRILVATGTVVHVLDEETGREEGAAPLRLPVTPSSLACGEQGVLIALDRARTLGILPSSMPGSFNRAVRVVEHVAGRAGGNLTTVAAKRDEGSASLAIGDTQGTVALFLNDFGPGMAPDQTSHRGPVTALSVADARHELWVASGGADGRVMLWGVSRPSSEAPVDERDSPVTAVAAAEIYGGLLTVAAWADGLVRLRRRGERLDTVLDLRLDAPVHSAVIDRGKWICLALPDQVLSITLD